MNARFSITTLTTVTFLFSCGVNGKLDRTLDEVHAMNQNMETMNKSMDKNMQAANQNMAEANKSFATLVTNLKPEEWIDQISDRFQQTLAQFTEGTGDITSLIKNGNKASEELLKFMSAFSPEELKDLGANIKEATGYMKGLNGFVANYSDDLKQLTTQMKVVPQLFVTLGAGMGMIDVKNSDALIASLQPHDPNPDVTNKDRTDALDLLSSTLPVTNKVTNLLSKQNLQYAQDHSYLKSLSEFTTSLNVEAKKAGSLKNLMTSAGSDVMGKFWSAKGVSGKPITIDTFMACMMLKLITDSFELQVTGSGSAAVNGDVTGWGPDAKMNLNGSVNLNGVSIKPANVQKIKDAYKNYCKDVKSFNFNP